MKMAFRRHLVDHCLRTHEKHSWGTLGGSGPHEAKAQAVGSAAAPPGPWWVLVLALVSLRSEGALSWGRGHFQTANYLLQQYFWEGYGTRTVHGGAIIIPLEKQDSFCSRLPPLLPFDFFFFHREERNRHKWWNSSNNGWKPHCWKYRWAALVPRDEAAPLPALFPGSAVELGSTAEPRAGLLPGPWHRDDR